MTIKQKENLQAACGELSHMYNDRENNCEELIRDIEAALAYLHEALRD